MNNRLFIARGCPFLVHKHEVRILKALKKSVKPKKDSVRASELAKQLGMKLDTCSRMSYSMSKKGLVNLKKVTDTTWELTKEGKQVLKDGLPEKAFLSTLPRPVSKIKSKKDRIALGWVLKRKWAEKEKDQIVAVVTRPPITPEEEALKNPNQASKKIIQKLKKRKWVKAKKSTDYEIILTKKGDEAEAETRVTRITPDLLVSGKWKDEDFTRFSPKDPVPANWPGRLHPMSEIVDRVRHAFLAMGFTEKRGPFIESAFWDFDALFVPQDHPARDMQDTFYIKGEAPLPDMPKVIKRVAEAHQENWGKWDQEQAKNRLLRTHTTCVSARTLANAKPPIKMFSVDKVFRNETVDYKHLPEFYQVEGIVFDKNVNFTHLLGYLKHFFSLLGFDKIRARPAYFPYTEFSTEVDIWLEDRGKWMELGGAGIFRPEVVKPLTGKDYPVLAWGLGLERLAMLHYGAKDIRQLYQSDLTWLRQRKVLL